MKFLAKHIKDFAADERGATAVEYGLFVAAIAAVIVAVVIGLGSTLNAKFTAVNTKISGLPTP